MNNYIRLFLLLLSLNLMIACSPDKTTDTTDSETLDVESSVEVDTNNSNDENATANDNCGSLKPLLQLLPQVSQIDGLPEVYRGCENSSEQTVSVLYANEGDEYTEYEFKIYVLNSESAYAKANLQVDGATEEQQSFMNKTFTTTGEMRQSILDTCRRYDQNPMIPDGRNPLIVQAHNLDVCVMDNLDANKEIWNAFAIKDDLEFRLELRGHKAGEILKTEFARDHLLPLFEQFGLDNNP